MTTTIEAIYENHILRPLSPIIGLHDNEKVLVVLCRKPSLASLRRVAGTLTHEEAEAMSQTIEKEFEHRE